MAKNYQAIDGKTLTFDKGVIRDVLGVAGSVIESQAIYLGTKVHKYAFYNTGELCEANFTENSPVLCVRCHGTRRKEILGWLQKYLINTMKSYEWETEIFEDKDDYFYARFYK